MCSTQVSKGQTMSNHRDYPKHFPNQTTLIEVREIKTIGSKQLTVKMDEDRYKQLRLNALDKGMTHRDIMLEGFDLWLKVHGTTY